jgi:hypothetical protein
MRFRSQAEMESCRDGLGGKKHERDEVSAQHGSGVRTTGCCRQGTAREKQQRKKKQREKKRGRKREESFPSHHSKMKIATRRFKLKLRSGAPRAEVPLEVIARAVCACLSAG